MVTYQLHMFYGPLVPRHSKSFEVHKVEWSVLKTI